MLLYPSTLLAFADIDPHRVHWCGVVDRIWLYLSERSKLEISHKDYWGKVPYCRYKLHGKSV